VFLINAMSEVEHIFDKLSTQYLSKIAEERKQADELQLVAIDNTLREWMSKLHQNGTTSGHSGNSHLQASEHDLLKDALSEAKDRQGRIISVSPFLISFYWQMSFYIGNERGTPATA
jgi:hypothetical protein